MLIKLKPSIAAVVALTLAMALVAIGCGSDSETGTAAGSGASDTTSAATDGGSDGAATDGGGEATGKPLTKAQFITQGDAICAKTKKRQTTAVGLYLQEHPNAFGSRKGQVEAIAEAGLPPLVQQNEELAALSPPKGDEAEVEAIISGFEEALAEAEEDPAALVNGRGAFPQVEKLAQAYGMKTCANVS